MKESLALIRSLASQFKAAEGAEHIVRCDASILLSLYPHNYSFQILASRTAGRPDGRTEE
ncbi:hypothetical protein Mapa_012256 [Marchantia paleacea]|nr:hypothetical protein Mapa_012256 [Marchantia paleacea]